MRAIIIVYAFAASLHILLDRLVLANVERDRRLLETICLAGEAGFQIVSASALYMTMKRLLRVQREALAAESAAQTESARAGSLLRSVVDGSPDGIFAKDREGPYLLWHPGAAGWRSISSNAERPQRPPP